MDDTQMLVIIEPMRTEFERRLKAKTGRDDWVVTARIQHINYQFVCALDMYRCMTPPFDLLREPEWNIRLEDGVVLVAAHWYRFLNPPHDKGETFIPAGYWRK